MSAPSFPALMFAAGFGTRMKKLTQDRPKPLIEVAGRPLIDHALDLAQQESCDPIVANLHYKADMLSAHLSAKDVRTVIEAPHILETGGGLRNALSILGNHPVVTLNTDAVWAGPNPVALLRNFWNPDKMDALLICIPRENAIGYQRSGDFLLSETGKIKRGPGLVYGGVQIIKTEELSDITETAFSLNLLWDRMLRSDRLYGLCYPGKWCDVGHPEGIKMAEKMLENDHV
ncbi:MAG: nucleotidyltransferase family protein [Sulfitobacter sp.]